MEIQLVPVVSMTHSHSLMIRREIQDLDTNIETRSFEAQEPKVWRHSRMNQVESEQKKSLLTFRSRHRTAVQWQVSSQSKHHEGAENDVELGGVPSGLGPIGN